LLTVELFTPARRLHRLSRRIKSNREDMRQGSANRKHEHPLLPSLRHFSTQLSGQAHRASGFPCMNVTKRSRDGTTAILSMEDLKAVHETWRTLRFMERFAETIVSGSTLEASAGLNINTNDRNVLWLPNYGSVSAVSICTSPFCYLLPIHVVLEVLTVLGRQHLLVDTETTICIA
jgi:hypothetical protein